ncbi:CoA pyrophosphatase [Sphingopyxis terrae]|uniref:CoA pyrophosphatase n=1 Tax=Sphingopyxis terrae TaxID=33052 RepID=UPI002A157474|nr:CoA pyrophosphatase [Sphingopyxis terrae]MDX8357183.1 CoA pyrophosphatase [Sphingopyxis terrae]
MLSAKLRDALDNLLPEHGEDEGYLLHRGDSLRDAAVLIAFTDRPDPGVILTQRPQWLRSHAGQVAFPGGKIDPGDADAVDAALREAEEEIGLHRRDVAVAGTTDAYRSGSGYHITPVLGVIPPDLPLDPNPDEVEDWFEVPLDILFDPANYERQQAHWQGQVRRYYDMHWQGRRIWGVTADIIINLARRLPPGWHR